MNRETKSNFVVTATVDSDLILQAFEDDRCCGCQSQAEMSLADIHRISVHLGIPMTAVYDKFCVPSLSNGSFAATGVFLKSAKEHVSCPFAQGDKCTLGRAKPTSCRMRPLVRNFRKSAERVWRVGYFLPAEPDTTGTVNCKVSDLLLKSHAIDTEVSYGQLQLGLLEVERHYNYIANAIGKAPQPRITLEALRHMYTDWENTKTLDENAMQNRTTYRQTLWHFTEPVLGMLNGQ